MTSDTLVVTPWFPTADRPFYGAFVAEWVRAMRGAGVHPRILHVETVPGGTETVETESTFEGLPLVHVSVPVSAKPTRNQLAEATEVVLREILPRRFPDVTVVHGHVVIPVGWALARTLPATTRLVLTEHASYLVQIFRDPESTAMYAAAVARAEAVTAVSAAIAEDIIEAVPAHANRIRTLGNPIAFERFRLLTGTRDQHLVRWLYMGNFLLPKGLLRLIESFAAARDRWPASAPEMLTLVGDGVARDELIAKVRELGIEEYVEFQPPVPPDKVPDVYAQHDVLVHLSAWETFGLTAVEAIASGLPVIVTRCGGPEETLLHATELGVAEYVEVDDDPWQVVGAWRRLRSRQAGADWPAARRLLEHRYATEVVGRRIAEMLGAIPPHERGEPRGRVQVLTIDVANLREAAPAVQLLVDLGLAVDVRTLVRQKGITLKRGLRPGPPPAAVRLPGLGGMLSRGTIGKHSLRGLALRYWVAHHPREVAAAVQRLVDEHGGDILLVDAFVGSGQLRRRIGHPAVHSLTTRSFMWEHVAELLGDPVATSSAGVS